MTASRRKPTSAKADHLMDTPTLAAYLDVEAETVKEWRRRREGPPYIRINGRLVRYRLSAVDEWLESQTEGAA